MIARQDFKSSERLYIHMSEKDKSDKQKNLYLQNLQDIKQKFRNYKLNIAKKEEADKNLVNVSIYTSEGEEYTVDFVTLTYVNEMMKTWQETGDHAGGCYFPTSNLIIIKDFKENTIRKTIDDMIDSLLIDSHFIKQE